MSVPVMFALSYRMTCGIVTYPEEPQKRVCVLRRVAFMAVHEAGLTQCPERGLKVFFDDDGRLICISTRVCCFSGARTVFVGSSSRSLKAFAVL